MFLGAAPLIFHRERPPKPLLPPKGNALRVQVELDPNVDRVLSQMAQVVTADAIILDKCQSWYNLNREILARFVPDAWIFRFSQ